MNDQVCAFNRVRENMWYLKMGNDNFVGWNKRNSNLEIALINRIVERVHLTNINEKSDLDMINFWIETLFIHLSVANKEKYIQNYAKFHINMQINSAIKNLDVSNCKNLANKQMLPLLWKNPNRINIVGCSKLTMNILNIISQHSECLTEFSFDNLKRMGKTFLPVTIAKQIQNGEIVLKGNVRKLEIFNFVNEMILDNKVDFLDYLVKPLAKTLRILNLFKCQNINIGGTFFHNLDQSLTELTLVKMTLTIDEFVQIGKLSNLSRLDIAHDFGDLCEYSQPKMIWNILAGGLTKLTRLNLCGTNICSSPDSENKSDYVMFANLKWLNLLNTPNNPILFDKLDRCKKLGVVGAHNDKWFLNAMNQSCLDNISLVYFCSFLNNISMMIEDPIECRTNATVRKQYFYTQFFKFIENESLPFTQRCVFEVRNRIRHMELENMTIDIQLSFVNTLIKLSQHLHLTNHINLDLSYQKDYIEQLCALVKLFVHEPINPVLDRVQSHLANFITNELCNSTTLKNFRFNTIFHPLHKDIMSVYFAFIQNYSNELTMHNPNLIINLMHYAIKYCWVSGNYEEHIYSVLRCVKKLVKMNFQLGVVCLRQTFVSEMMHLNLTVPFAQLINVFCLSYYHFHSTSFKLILSLFKIFLTTSFYLNELLTNKIAFAEIRTSLETLDAFCKKEKPTRSMFSNKMNKIAQILRNVFLKDIENRYKIRLCHINQTV